MHAVGGRRTEYAPVVSAAGARVDGDAGALARVYVSDLGAHELYVADLDAIDGGTAAANREIVAAVTSTGAPLWLDAGVSSVEAARTVVALGASVVVVGLETLTSFDALTAICTAVGPRRVAFSIDLRDGTPVTLPNAGHAHLPATALAERAATAGVGHVIVLDLARVGTRSGIDVEVVSAIRHAAPRVALFAGGGVRSQSDIDRLRAVSCDGALVATALLTGAIRAGEDQTRQRNVAD